MNYRYADTDLVSPGSLIAMQDCHSGCWPEEGLLAYVWYAAMHLQADFWSRPPWLELDCFSRLLQQAAPPVAFLQAALRSTAALLTSDCHGTNSCMLLHESRLVCCNPHQECLLDSIAASTFPSCKHLPFLTYGSIFVSWAMDTSLALMTMLISLELWAFCTLFCISMVQLHMANHLLRQPCFVHLCFITMCNLIASSCLRQPFDAMFVFMDLS